MRRSALDAASNASGHLGLHHLPQLRYVPLLGRFATERDPDHPSAIQGRRCEVRFSGFIDSLYPCKRVGVERLDYARDRREAGRVAR